MPLFLVMSMGWRRLLLWLRLLVLLHLCRVQFARPLRLLLAPRSLRRTLRPLARSFPRLLDRVDMGLGLRPPLVVHFCRGWLRTFPTTRACL